MDLNQVTLPSTNIERSISFYCAMGFTLIFDAPHYARFECPEGKATFSVHMVNEAVSNSGVVIYFESERLDQLTAELLAKEIEFDQLPQDESWLWREARLRDPDGNVLCLFYAGTNRQYPPWRVQQASVAPEE